MVEVCVARDAISVVVELFSPPATNMKDFAETVGATAIGR